MFHLPDNHHNFSLRLSEVLDDIGLNERMVLKRRRVTLLDEAIETVTLGHPTYYHFGSQSEGTTTIGLRSDRDTLANLHECNVIQDYAEWKLGYLNLLMIHDDITSPGYCHLQLIKSDVPLPETDIDVLNGHCFLDANDRLLLKNTFIKDVKYLTGGIFSGPAYTSQGKPGFRDGDLVPAFPCKSWPYEARNWLNGHLGRWPTSSTKRYAENTGCFVVPVGSKVSQMEQLEWRISTSKAERCLMFNLNMTQIRCYVLLKMILKTYLYHPISSFMCKTVLLHCIKNSNPNLWQDNNLFTCLSYCLQVLFNSILHQSCPHFIIHRNNLMAGEFSPVVKADVLKRMRFVLESHGHTLFGIQIDNLGQRLCIKMNRMHHSVQNVYVPSSSDVCFVISENLVSNLATNISACTSKILRDITNHSQSYETVFQHLRHTIFNYVRRYQEGTYSEKAAISFLAPFLCSTLGSVLASFNIGRNNSVSPEALSWLSAGQNSDVSSCRLKIASVFYCAGDLLRTEFILQETEIMYCLDTVGPVCMCYDSVKNANENEFCSVCYNQDEKAISSVCAFCIRFIPAEMNCIPYELQYELYRTTQDDLRHRHKLYDNWMDWAVVDSLPFLYFLQYKTYGHLNRYNDQQRALTNLVRTTITKSNFGHRETALNLLGQCMEQENRPNDALKCYTTSLNVRERNNVARFHICCLLASMLNIVP